MINIIIIDDDRIVSDVLSTAVNWNDLGYNLAGVFARSCDALDFLSNNHIDVILTDIRMPKPDGIELIEHCHTYYPDIKFIICSAYRDFSYAQSALRYGNTIDYLTKPLDFLLLEKVLKQLSATFCPSPNNFNSFDASIIQYIENNYSTKLSLDKVAGNFFMSPQYFSVYFKKLTNKKFIDFLTELRMKKACELLENTKLSTANICQEIGYSHLGHFYELFKKYYGMTPQEYRKNLRKD